MKPGDLVKIDTPGLSEHGKIGIIVRRHMGHLMNRINRVGYEIMVEDKIHYYFYQNLLEEGDWEHEPR